MFCSFFFVVDRSCSGVIFVFCGLFLAEFAQRHRLTSFLSLSLSSLSLCYYVAVISTSICACVCVCVYSSSARRRGRRNMLKSGVFNRSINLPMVVPDDGE